MEDPPIYRIVLYINIIILLIASFAIGIAGLFVISEVPDAQHGPAYIVYVQTEEKEVPFQLTPPGQVWLYVKVSAYIYVICFPLLLFLMWCFSPEGEEYISDQDIKNGEESRIIMITITFISFSAMKFWAMVYLFNPKCWSYFLEFFPSLWYCMITELSLIVVNITLLVISIYYVYRESHPKNKVEIKIDNEIVSAV